MYNRHLDSFIKVADCGSFSKAAKPLFVSANALIKRINLLEAELGVALFKRTSHGVSLTEAGRSVYRDARRIIQLSRQTLATAHALAGGKQNVIRLGGSLMNPCRPIVKLWTAASALHPGIRLQIVPVDDGRNDKVEQFDRNEGGVDVIAGLIPSTLWKNRCRALEIRQTPLAVAVPVNHPLASRERLCLTDLYGETLLMVERGDTAYVDRLRDELERSHPQIRIHDVPPYDLGTFNYAEATGKPMVSAGIWADVHPSLVTIPCDWGQDYCVPYGLLYAREPQAHVAEFVEILKDQLRHQPGTIPPGG
ncbi:MAG: LysR family transcriptional regulator [Desulfovibrio sp.]|nr:LysR family transcriptional regulator [Desulfovibrio sp.]